MSSQPVQTRPLVITLLLILLAVAQLSCSSFPRLDVGPYFNLKIDLDLEEVMRELYPEEEMLFIKWCSDTLEAEPRVNKRFKMPNVLRSLTVCFTYADKEFPEKMPDGVWRVDISNYGVPDARLLREPVGKEIRGNNEHTVKAAVLFARQRSEKATRLTGEVSMLYETVRDKRGQTQYQFFSVRIVGAYDPQEKKWSLVSKSVGPVGQP